MSRLQVNGLTAEDYEWHASVCRSKVRYETRTLAKEFGKAATKRFGIELKPYECEICNRWHLKSK